MLIGTKWTNFTCTINNVTPFDNDGNPINEESEDFKSLKFLNIILVLHKKRNIYNLSIIRNEYYDRRKLYVEIHPKTISKFKFGLSNCDNVHSTMTYQSTEGKNIFKITIYDNICIFYTNSFGTFTMFSREELINFFSDTELPDDKNYIKIEPTNVYYFDICKYIINADRNMLNHGQNIDQRNIINCIIAGYWDLNLIYNKIMDKIIFDKHFSFICNNKPIEIILSFISLSFYYLVIYKYKKGDYGFSEYCLLHKEDIIRLFI